jgi:hypothetical protein
LGYGRSIAVDTNGCAYITGKTESTDFPIQNPYMIEPGDGNWDAYITKLSADGQSLVYSTYFGGDDYDAGYGIAVDTNGCAYITGKTESTDFPLQNPYMIEPGDGNCDAFVTKFSTDGQSLVYSSYLGGTSYDYGNSIAVDANGCAYITGGTGSTDFPTQNPYMTDPGDGNCDAFVTKFSTDGQSLVYSTYLGGSFCDSGHGIAINTNGCAYVTGHTRSISFPTQNPIISYKGGCDAFVTKFSTDGQSLVYSTYLGGTSYDYGNSIAVDANGCAYVTGLTQSTDFPTQNPIMIYQWIGDAFVTKLSADGQSLVYSTYLGGSVSEWAYGIAVDSNECAYVTGLTCSSDFPTQNTYMSYPGDYNVYLTKFSADGQFLIYSTYLGGNEYDAGYGIAVDANECAYITGYTNSRDFPLKNSIMSYQGNGDAFVVAFKPFKPLIILNISGSRKTERVWIIKRDYGELNLLVDNPSEVNVSKYVIYRKVNNGMYKAIYEISGSFLIEGSYIYNKFLDKDKTYTYKFIAYDSNGNLIALSNEISI